MIVGEKVTLNDLLRQRHENAVDGREVDRARDEVQQMRARFCPHQLFKLARQNVAVCAFLKSWEMGSLSFDEMLIGMVDYLVGENDKLLKELTKQFWARPPEPVVREKQP